jgi:hypothetical protein
MFVMAIGYFYRVGPELQALWMVKLSLSFNGIGLRSGEWSVFFRFLEESIHGRASSGSASASVCVSHLFNT